MNNGMNDVFAEYENIYLKIFDNIYPAKNSTGFPERNLSVNFSKAYERITAAKDQESISWFELQFGVKNNFHADAVIINISSGELFIVEAKRFSNPSSKIKEISKDIMRIHELVSELREENRIAMDRIQRCYGVILADIWTKRGLREDILKSYIAGQKNPQDKNSFIKRFLPELGICNVQYDVRKIRIFKTYYLLSFLWEII
ncbi:hypothetical protein IMSAG049_00848 [Clostridiales bacterium]|nr:hypothetical protein IMSAG049_00848 [Clostridiales bacterium]